MDEEYKERLYQLIGDRIRKARKSTPAKVSQEWLAKQLGMTRTSIVNIEAGRQHATLHVLWQIAEKLNVPLAVLIPGREEYNEYEEAIKLDTETIARIEMATATNPQDRHFVEKFVASKSKTS